MKAAALALLVALQAAPGDQDVVVMKGGDTRTGRIVSETATEIVLETFIKSSKGQVVGSAKATIPKSDVERIERASTESRKAAEERSKAFSERGVRRAEALAKIFPVFAKFDGLQGLQVTGSQYVLLSDCDPSFIKELAVTLDEIFAAYRRHFDIRRNAERKLKIYVFSDRIEYDTHNMARMEGRVMAVAYYSVPDNTIAAYNMVEREKERMIRQETQEAQKDIERFRGEALNLERQIVGQERILRQKVQDEAAEIRRQIRQDGQAGKPQRLAEIDRQEKQLLEELRDGKAAAQKELQDARRRANEAIEKCGQVIDRNEKVIARQNGAMLETLFHEGFHAFASNYLWEGSGQREFPRWLHEGMACYFERSVVEGGTLIHGSPHPRFLNLVKDRYLFKTAFPVEKLIRSGAENFTLSHASEAEERTAYYAQSWALAHYLTGKTTPKQVEAYVNDVLAGKDAVESFERMTGKKCAQVEVELRAYIDAMR
jgi:hypothetical protein